MPNFQMASEYEQTALTTRASAAVDLTPYKTALTTLLQQPDGEHPGYSRWAKLSLTDGENRKSVLRRFSQAAREMDLHVGNRRHATDQAIVWLRLRPPPVAKTPSANGLVKRVKKAA